MRDGSCRSVFDYGEPSLGEKGAEDADLLSFSQAFTSGPENFYFFLFQKQFIDLFTSLPIFVTLLRHLFPYPLLPLVAFGEGKNQPLPPTLFPKKKG